MADDPTDVRAVRVLADGYQRVVAVLSREGFGHYPPHPGLGRFSSAWQNETPDGGACYPDEATTRAAFIEILRDRGLPIGDDGTFRYETPGWSPPRERQCHLSVQSYSFAPGHPRPDRVLGWNNLAVTAGETLRSFSAYARVVDTEGPGRGDPDLAAIERWAARLYNRLGVPVRGSPVMIDAVRRDASPYPYLLATAPVTEAPPPPTAGHRSRTTSPSHVGVPAHGRHRPGSALSP